jgi:hypothetical protein
MKPCRVAGLLFFSRLLSNSIPAAAFCGGLQQELSSIRWDSNGGLDPRKTHNLCSQMSEIEN